MILPVVCDFLRFFSVVVISSPLCVVVVFLSPPRPHFLPPTPFTSTGPILQFPTIPLTVIARRKPLGNVQPPLYPLVLSMI